MINTLLGIKKGMTSKYDARGRRVGATVVELSPNFVTQVKSSEGNDGYTSVQIGAGNKKSVKKPQLGHYKKANVSQSLRFLREIRVDDVSEVQLGQEIKVGDVFSKGDLVKVTGTSKGRGFAGSVKRFGFAGGPKTHGQSDRERAPGSSGQGTSPGRVYKGKRRAGHMGVETVSYKGVEVLEVDKKNGLITVKGGIPGPVGSLVRIEKQGVVKGYTPEPEEEEVIEDITGGEESVSEAPVEETVESLPESQEVAAEEAEKEQKEETNEEIKEQENA